MKSKNWKLCCAAMFLAMGISNALSQAERDNRIIGTYQGAIGPGSTAGGQSNIIQITGGLFVARINHNTLGYHEGRLVQGVLFSYGRAEPLTGSIVVAPFPDRNNRDLTIDFGELTLTGESGVDISGYPAAGEATYVDRAPGSLLRGNITYEGLFDPGFMNCEMELAKISPRFLTSVVSRKVQR